MQTSVQCTKKLQIASNQQICSVNVYEVTVTCTLYSTMPIGNCEQTLSYHQRCCPCSQDPAPQREACQSSGRGHPQSHQLGGCVNDKDTISPYTSILTKIIHTLQMAVYKISTP